MKKLNKKGFTLVELLVAISVLAIIMVIALPQISNIKSQNQTTKYRKYADSVLSSAKLYTDSYTEDMFGNNKSGCVDVPYSELRNKDLVKDIKLDGASCNNAGTYIRVRKANDHYFYERSIVCKDSSGKTVYTENLDPDGCAGGGPDTTGPQIKVTPNSKNWTKGKDETVTIKIWDAYGMLENVKIEYSWTKDGNAYGTVMSHNFKNKRYDGNSESNALTHTFKVPQGETGVFVLAVKPVDVRDSVGNYQTTSYTSGQFKLDNTKPIITGTTNDRNSQWTNQNVKITAEANDGHSGVKKIYYYYDEGENKDDWDSGSTATSVTGTWSAERNKEVFIIAEDNVGNKSAVVSAGYVKIDKTAPTVGTVTNSKDNVWTNETVYIEAEASDNSSGSGVSEIYYYYPDGVYHNDWDVTKTATKVKGSWTGERDNTVTIIAKDKAGNYSATKSAGTIKIDKTAPVISSIVNDKNGVATTAGHKVTLNGSDTGTYQSGIAKWRYHYPDESWTDLSNSASTSYTDTYNSLREKTTVTYGVCDVAGNCSADDTTDVFIVDQCDSRYIKYTDGTTCSEACGNGTYNQIATSKLTNAACTAHNKSSGGGTCKVKDCITTINATRYYDCNAYYITTCEDGTCTYTKKNASATTNTIAESNLSTTIGSGCDKTYCSATINSLSGTTVKYNINGGCTVKSYGADSPCTKENKGTTSFKVGFASVSLNNRCGVWIEANEPLMVTPGSNLKYKISWETIKCADGWYCTSKCGSSACVGTKPAD